MSKTLIQDVVKLINEGWRPYNAEPDTFVYEKLGCRNFLRGRKGHWFVRGDIFCCIGCGAHCTLSRPAGFPLPLPIRYTTPPPDQPYTLTQAEMATRFDNLTVRQASYCLNISERLVYDWIEEGKLVRLKDIPVRVRSQEVRELMQDFDE